MLPSLCLQEVKQNLTQGCHLIIQRLHEPRSEGGPGTPEGTEGAARLARSPRSCRRASRPGQPPPRGRAHGCLLWTDGFNASVIFQSREFTFPQPPLMREASPLPPRVWVYLCATFRENGLDPSGVKGPAISQVCSRRASGRWASWR